MLRKRPITLLFTVVVATIALFTVTKVGAECPDLVDTVYYKYFECNKYRVEADDPVVGPCTLGSGECTTFKYSVVRKSGAKTLSHAALLHRRRIEVVSVSCNPTCTPEFDCANDYTGDESSGFGSFLTKDCMIKINWPDFGNYGTITLEARGNLVGTPNDLFFKVGSRFSDQVFGALIAADEPCKPEYAAYAGIANEDVTRIKNTCIKIKRDPLTGCGFAIYYQEACSGDWIQLSPIDNPKLEGMPVVECGNTRGIPDYCDECRVTSASSPGWTWIKLGGRWYKTCIGYLWTATKCCNNPPGSETCN